MVDRSEQHEHSQLGIERDLGLDAEEPRVATREKMSGRIS
jgi:hypothetical protein